MIHEALEKVVAGEDLTRADMEAVMEEFHSGQATPTQMSAFFTALRMKGETKEERAGADAALARHASEQKNEAAHCTVGYETGHAQFCESVHFATMIIGRGADLSRREAECAMEDILSGCAEDSMIAAFLAALRFKG